VQPASPAGTPAPADPSASFAALAAAAGATVTAVTGTAQPAAVASPRPATPLSEGSDSADGSAPAAVPVTGATPGLPPLPAAGGQSAGTGNPGQDGGSSDPSQDGVPDLAGLPQGPSTAPLAAPAAPDAAKAPAPAPPVGGQIAQHIAVLRGVDDGEHSMTLVLTPERLGPVEIQVTVSKGTLDLSLRGAHEQGRAALLEALPELRRDLQSAGLTCSRLEVERTTGGAFTSATTSSASAGLGQSAAQTSQQQTPGQRGGQQDWSDGRFRPGLRTADSGDNRPIPVSTRSTSPGVDVRV
jgi:flagellar hook-length control protein FliK